MARPAEAPRPNAPPPVHPLERAWLGRGPLALALLPIAALFGGLVAARRALYRWGILRSRQLPVPLIVVGNFIVGGAGKTPTVLALVKLLSERGWTPGVVSRGHGRHGAGVLDVSEQTSAAESGDEPLLLHLRLRVPVVVGRDRWAAAQELLRLHPAVDVLLSDDGLQHLRLARDVQVLVFDERGAGNGWVLPAGPLREPMPRTTPARSLVLYNASAPTTSWHGTLARRKLMGVVLLADWWAGREATPAALAGLAQRPLLAAAGMARPTRFFEMLGAAGLRFEACPLPDHYDFATLPWPEDTPDVVLTEKDAVKLHPGRLGSTRVWVAPLDFRTDAAFDTALFELLPQRPTPRNDHHGNAIA